MSIDFIPFLFRNTQIIRSSLDALKRNKVRSFLTSIGIIIGVSSVIIVIGIASSAKLAVKQKVVSFGANSMYVGWSAKPITERDYFQIKRLDPAIQYVSPSVEVPYVKIRADLMSDQQFVMGVSPDYILMREWSIYDGRIFDQSEIDGSQSVAVIGSYIQKQYFGDYSAVGRILYLNDMPFKVIGVLEETGTSLSGKVIDKVILIPYTTGFVRFIGDRTMFGLQISTYEGSMVEPVQKLVEEYFRDSHRLLPGQKNDFDITTSKGALKTVDDITSILTYLLAGVASISLIVGGIGIMNIMLVSVSERTREIGIRSALGAKRVHILLQFLIEAVVLSLLGGLIGIIVGIFAYFAIMSAMNWEFIFSVWAIVISFLFAVITGVFFGFYPARKASKLRPIDALRYE